MVSGGLAQVWGRPVRVLSTLNGGAENSGGAGEGGLGKVTMDLGVPGLVIFAWLAVTVLRLILAAFVRIVPCVTSACDSRVRSGGISSVERGGIFDRDAGVW